MKEISIEEFETTKVLNNIKNHDFTVADYKMCKRESEIAIRALTQYLDSLKYDGLTVVNTLESAT